MQIMTSIARAHAREAERGVTANAVTRRQMKPKLQHYLTALGGNSRSKLETRADGPNYQNLFTALFNGTWWQFGVEN